MIRPTRKQIEAAVKVLNDEGFNICLPWEGDLDDVERARYEAVKGAIAAAINVAVKGA